MADAIDVFRDVVPWSNATDRVLVNLLLVIETFLKRYATSVTKKFFPEDFVILWSVGTL